VEGLANLAAAVGRRLAHRLGALMGGHLRLLLIEVGVLVLDREDHARGGSCRVGWVVLVDLLCVVKDRAADRVVLVGLALAEANHHVRRPPAPLGLEGALSFDILERREADIELLLDSLDCKHRQALVLRIGTANVAPSGLWPPRGAPVEHLDGAAMCPLGEGVWVKVVWPP